MSEPTKPIPFRDLVDPTLRMRQITAEPSSRFYIPPSDAALEKLLADVTDPNEIASVTKMYLKNRGVLDPTHPDSELGTTLNPHVRPTASVQRSPANETASLPSARLTEMIQTATDPSQLQIALSLSREWESTVEVKQPEPPQPKLYDPRQNFFQKCYPHDNDEVIVSADSQEELDAMVDKIYGQYGKVRGVDFH